MNKCQRLGIKNFQTIRQPRRIQLAFDLCTGDASARRFVSSKADDYDQQSQAVDFNPLTIKRSPKNWSQTYEYIKISLSFISQILYWVVQMLCLFFKSAVCVLWCLFKIVRCTIFRLLIKSKRSHPKAFICQSIRCSHRQY